MACKADQLLPVASAVQTTTFCPGAALPMAATYSLMSTAGAGTSLGHYTLLPLVLRSHWEGQEWSEGVV